MEVLIHLIQSSYSFILFIHLIQKGSISHATKAVKNMTEDLQKRNKLIKIVEKSSGRLEHSSRISDDLASDSEDGKKLKAAEARALRKQKFKVKNNCFFFSANQHM